MISLVILDCDGTIVDSKKEYLHIIAKTLAPFGVTKEQCMPLIGQTLREILRTFVPSKRVPSLRDSINKKIIERLQYMSFVPSIEQLRAVHRRYHLAIVSNSDSAFVNQVLERLGAVDLFEQVLAGDLNISKTERIRQLVASHEISFVKAAFVGDMPSDIRSAHEAGVKAIALYTEASWVFPKKEKLELARPDRIITSYDELLLL